MAQRKTTTTYRQLSYYLFLHSSQHSHTGRQTDRHTQHTTPTTWGAFRSEEEGAWQRPFLFSLVHQLGVDTSHIIPVFFGGGGAPMKIPLIIPHQYQGSSSAVVHPRPEQQLTSGHQQPRQRTLALSAYSHGGSFTGIQETGDWVASCPQRRWRFVMHMLLLFFSIPPSYGSYSLSDGTLYIYIVLFFITTHQEHGVFCVWRLAPRGSLDTGILRKRGGINLSLN